jgi:hypothetical protein
VRGRAPRTPGGLNKKTARIAHLRFGGETFYGSIFSWYVFDQPSSKLAERALSIWGAYQIKHRLTAFPDMPRYFFHVRRGQMTVVDKVGVELADIGEAVKEAARRGREIATRESLNAVASEAGMIVIDEGWRTVLELPFEDTE